MSEHLLESKKEGQRVLAYLIAFFVIVAGVNIVFVYKALTTHSGVVAQNAYEIGLNYNDVIAEAKKRKNEHNSNH